MSDRWRKLLTLIAAILLAALAIWNGKPLHRPHQGPPSTDSHASP